MKKTTISFIIGLILLYFAVWQAHPLELYTFGSMSYDYNKNGIDYPSQEEWFEASLAAGISQDIWALHVYLETELTTEMKITEGLSWYPTHQNYYVRGGLWIGFLNIEYEHLCEHSIDAFNPLRGGGYDRITIGFDSRRKYDNRTD